MTDVRAVLFDLDDTLYPERRYLLSACRAVATALEGTHGVPRGDIFLFMRSWLRDHGRTQVLQAMRRHFDLPDSGIADLVDIMRAHQPDLRLPRGSVEVLQALRASGLRLGVLTNGLPAVQRRKISALGLAPLVDAIVYAEDHAPGGKPHPVAFARAVLRLQVPAAHTAFVGDHPVKDIGGAAAAGLRTVWISRTGPQAGVPADAVVDSLSAVPHALFVRLARLHAQAS